MSRETQFGHLFILQRGIIQPATVPFLNIAAYFSAQFYADSFCFCLFGFKILYQTVTGLKKDLSGVQKVGRTSIHLHENSKGYKIMCQVLLVLK